MHTTHINGAFSPLDSADRLDALVQASTEHPIVIFKHSPTCGTSAQAYDELEAFLEDDGSSEIFLVNVLASRALSQMIAARFRVRHESPQVLVLRNGEVRWHGSHFRVTAKNVSQARRAASEG